MTIPPFQTVLKIQAGAGPVPVARFVWGTPAAPFSVGSRGDWVVQAPRVEPVHFFLAFDGRLIQASGLPTGPRLLLNGVAVGQSWTPVPVSSELSFGDARVTVLCEELAPQAPAVPGDHRETKFVPDQPAPLPALPLGGGRTVAVPALQGVAWAPKMEPPAAGSGPETQPAPGLGFAPVPHVSRVLEPPRGEAAAGSPGQAAFPRTQESERMLIEGSGQAAADGAGAAPPMLVPAVGHPFETVSDAGALRQQASPIGSAPLASGDLPGLSPSDATQAAPPIPTRMSSDSPPERSLSGGFGAASPPVARYEASPPVGSPRWEAAHARGQSQASSPQRGVSQPGSPTTVSPLVKAWREASWPKRAVVILLPITAYFGVFYEPAPEAATPKPRRARVSAPNASVAAQTGSVASAQSPTMAAPAATLAAAPTSPAAAAAAAAPGATGAAVTVASAETASTTKGTPSKESQSGSTRNKDEKSSEERQALNAAFEGRLPEAADRYQQLASGTSAPKFSLAARFAREQAVRKP